MATLIPTACLTVLPPIPGWDVTVKHYGRPLHLFVQQRDIPTYKRWLPDTFLPTT